ncbi:MAG: hypothetical protein GXX99_08045 [Clostridiales bacterium]|nr:hypothetical protein [Clostridiales bacterium]
MINGVLYVAGPFEPGDIGQIERHFSALLGDQVTLKVRRDEALIGGFMAMVGGKVYDASFLANVRDIKRHMLDKE